MPSRLTLDDSKIIDLYKSGLGSTKIGKLLNMPKHTVIYRLKKNGIVLEGPKRNRICLDNLLICKLYSERQNLSDIAKKFSVSEYTIRNRLFKNGIKIRRAGPKRQIKINDFIFGKFDSSSCYWAGFFAADGCVFNNEISIHLHSQDKTHIEKFKEFLCTDVQVKKSINQNSHYMKFRSSMIAVDLKRNFNIVPCKSLILQPPLNIPDDLIYHYIRGYFDGDGYIGINKKVLQVEICSGSKDLLEWLNLHIRKFLKNNTTVRKRPNKNLFRIGIGGNRQIIQLMGLLYKDCGANFLERKRAKYYKFLEDLKS